MNGNDIFNNPYFPAWEDASAVITKVSGLLSPQVFDVSTHENARSILVVYIPVEMVSRLVPEHVASSFMRHYLLFAEWAYEALNVECWFKEISRKLRFRPLPLIKTALESDLAARIDAFDRQSPGFSFRDSFLVHMGERDSVLKEIRLSISLMG